mmetsp:Transcript_18512/g.34296  ORF Transcript_18512/g.34296 Transcript_18512/m.34296 type:complete len:86 (+) Transcript_18512:65-322(+)
MDHTTNNSLFKLFFGGENLISKSFIRRYIFSTPAYFFSRNGAQVNQFSWNEKLLWTILRQAQQNMKRERVIKLFNLHTTIMSEGL